MIGAMSEDVNPYPRDLSEADKLNFRSIPEVHAALSTVINNVGKDREILFRGRPKPKRAQVVNAVILFLESLPPAEQRRIVREGLAKLNGLLSEPVAAFEAETKAPPGEAGGEVERPVTRLDPGPGSVARGKARNGNHG